MTFNMRKWFIRVLVTASCLFWTMSATAAEKVVIGTGTTAATNIFFRIQEPIKKTDEIKLVIIVGGPVQALKDLDIGMVEAAVGGVNFTDWMTMMEKAGSAVPDPKAYKSQVIGKDIIQVITNKDTMATALSKEQLADIFSGSIKNWADVGGVDRPIVVFMNTMSPGTQFVFQKQILEDRTYSPDMIKLNSDGDLKARVRSTPGAIALATQGQIDESVNVPAIPTVERPITLITKAAPSDRLEKVLAYIRGPGQQFIVK